MLPHDWIPTTIGDHQSKWSGGLGFDHFSPFTPKSILYRVLSLRGLNKIPPKHPSMKHNKHYFNPMRKAGQVLAIGALALLPLAPDAMAQQKDGKSGKNLLAELTKEKDKDEPKSIDEVVKKCRKIPGLFNLYQDTTNGSVYLEVSKAQVGKEFIYFVHSTDGASATGHFRGSYRGSSIFKVGKHYNRIEFTVQNTNYHFDTTNALSKAADANISHALLYSGAIVAQGKDKSSYLVKADELFLSEAFHQIKPTPNPQAPPFAQFNMGGLSKDKTRYGMLRNYPQNTDVNVTYVYDNPSPMNGGGADIADPRSVMVSVQHSFIEVPANDFKPRKDDPRVGYFNEQQEHMTSTSATPFHDYIHRWNLVKKDPNVKVSEPVEPIVWWIEKTTPVEIRPIIKKAGETWNVAFEAAGFRNAVIVKEQADTATWDAGDIRYNVLRWTSSPNPPFGGYGPSFVNPRTGQILGADIMLEWVFLTNKLVQGSTYETAGLTQYLNQQSLEQALHNNDHKHHCAAGLQLQHNLVTGATALTALGSSPEDVKRFYDEGIYYLILHEMGHTMGLMHNMKASQLHGVPAVYDRTKTEPVGLTGSVMDYPAANLSPEGMKGVQYFTTRPGPYDIWAITYGYSPSVTDPKQEEARLNAILARSTEPGLAFGNDADDMRAPGKAIDPRVMIGDMSSDAISYGISRIQLVNKVLPTLKAKFTKPGESYQEFRDRFLRLTGEKATQAGVISRYVGGVYVDRSMVGQSATAKPYTPVALADQKRAMAALSQYIFAPTAWDQATDVYAYLAMQRRGFNFFGGPEDPKLTGRVLGIQKDVLAHLLSPSVVQRLIDSELYGNKYKLNDMMTDLTNAIFKADAATAVNVYRQNLQADYVNSLITAAGLADKGKSPYGYIGQAAALSQLMSIKAQLATAAPVADAATKAHRTALLFNINQAMKRN